MVSTKVQPKRPLRSDKAVTNTPSSCLGKWIDESLQNSVMHASRTVYLECLQQIGWRRSFALLKFFVEPTNPSLAIHAMSTSL